MTKKNMEKARSITYWIATVWLCFGMASSGVLQLLHTEMEVDYMAHLGYPLYFLTILGGWKLLGVIALLSPRYPLIKEWAYAGFFFAMSGAFMSHLSVGDGFGEMFPSLLLLVLTVLSWYFRPASRRIK